MASVAEIAPLSTEFDVPTSTGATKNIGKIIPELKSSPELIEFSHRTISGVLLVITIAIFIKSFNAKTPPLWRKLIWLLTFSNGTCLSYSHYYLRAAFAK